MRKKNGEKTSGFLSVNRQCYFSSDFLWINPLAMVNEAKACRKDGSGHIVRSCYLSDDFESPDNYVTFVCSRYFLLEGEEPLLLFLLPIKAILVLLTLFFGLIALFFR